MPGRGSAPGDRRLDFTTQTTEGKRGRRLKLGGRVWKRWIR
ncbi:hypothetical protein CLOM621_05332 [Clostridium sp. M62/1]|nr:hypothetical protein CLOM621_05332 [Clostridium sp. M62/1]